MEAIKELVEKLFLHPTRALEKTFNLEEQMVILDKCKYMHSLSIWNEVNTF
jgi:hypothetical protein